MANTIYINMLLVVTMVYFIFATWATIHRELREREEHYAKRAKDELRLRRERGR